jgi:dTMP kinase
MARLLPNRYRGKLIVVERIDGSGKSTQLALLSQWLRSQEIAVSFSEWNSSDLVRGTTRRGKKKQMFTPTTFSLIHATDFADRMERYIFPLLKAGAVVCADRYAYTAFARDVARGVSRPWVRNLYRFAIRPNLAFYFRVPLRRLRPTPQDAEQRRRRLAHLRARCSRWPPSGPRCRSRSAR